MMTNAITLKFRDRTTTANSLMVLFMVFCGLVCPMQLMPTWAQWISKALLLTYGIRLMRASPLATEAVNVTNDVVILLVLGVIYVGLGALTLAQIEKNLEGKRCFLSSNPESMIVQSTRARSEGSNNTKSALERMNTIARYVA